MLHRDSSVSVKSSRGNGSGNYVKMAKESNFTPFHHDRMVDFDFVFVHSLLSLQILRSAASGITILNSPVCHINCCHDNSRGARW